MVGGEPEQGVDHFLGDQRPFLFRDSVPADAAADSLVRIRAFAQPRPDVDPACQPNVGQLIDCEEELEEPTA